MQLQTSSRVSSATRDILASCPTDRYLVVSQPNLNAAHLETKSAVPRLREALGRAQDSFTVAEMTGDITSEAISNLVRNACAGRHTSGDFRVTWCHSNTSNFSRLTHRPDTIHIPIFSRSQDIAAPRRQHNQPPSSTYCWAPLFFSAHTNVEACARMRRISNTIS